MFFTRDMRTEQNKTRIVYLDTLRIFATFAVMILHVAASKWGETDVDSVEWCAMNFYDSIVRWAVPIFVMISGALFLKNDSPISIKTIYHKNIFRIARVFVFWSSVYAILRVIQEVFVSKQSFSLANFAEYVINGHYHMWFLFMIVGIYMIVPFMKEISRSGFLTKYFLALAFVFAILIPQSKSIAIMFIHGHDKGIGSFYEKVSVNFVMGFPIYFLLGYVLSKAEISRKMERLIYAAGLVGFVATFLLTHVISNFKHNATEIFYDTKTLNVFLESVCVFVFFRQHMNFKAKNSNWLILLSQYSFGAYLVHDLVIQMLRFIGLNTVSFAPALSIPVISVIVFVISFAFSGILNNIPVVKKYVL